MADQRDSHHKRNDPAQNLTMTEFPVGQNARVILLPWEYPGMKPLK